MKSPIEIILNQLSDNQLTVITHNIQTEITMRDGYLAFEYNRANLIASFPEHMEILDAFKKEYSRREQVKTNQPS